MSEKCQHKGCYVTSIPCYLLDEGQGEQLGGHFCPEHASLLGHCSVCGSFWGGIESFEFIHPGICDHCWDEIRSNEGETDYDEETDDGYEFDIFEDMP